MACSVGSDKVRIFTLIIVLISYVIILKNLSLTCKPSITPHQATLWLASPSNGILFVII